MLNKQYLMIEKAKECRDILYPGVYGPQNKRKLGCRQKKKAAANLRSQTARELSRHDDNFLLKYVDSTLSHRLHVSEMDLWNILGKREHQKKHKCELEEDLIQKLNEFYVTEMDRYRNTVKSALSPQEAKCQADLARLRQLSALKEENIRDYQIDDFYLETESYKHLKGKRASQRDFAKFNAQVPKQSSPMAKLPDLIKKKDSNQPDQI